jgi:hypothetical protein
MFQKINAACEDWFVKQPTCLAILPACLSHSGQHTCTVRAHHTHPLLQTSQLHHAG